MWLECLKVYDVNFSKVRVGNASDGGYILNDEILKCAEKLVSIGIGYDDGFELDWVDKFPDSTIEMYDGTYPCNNICNKYPEKINRNIFYYHKNVGNKPDQINLSSIINKDNKKTLLKIDIEGGEYEIFDSITIGNNIIGLTLEVHDLYMPINQNKLYQIINNNFQNMILFHIHGNAHGNSFELEYVNSSNEKIILPNFPHVIELSFINKNIVGNYGLETNTFPVLGLDASNKEDSPDIDLYWVNKV